MEYKLLSEIDLIAIHSPVVPSKPLDTADILKSIYVVLGSLSSTFGFASASTLVTMLLACNSLVF